MIVIPEIAAQSNLYVLYDARYDHHRQPNARSITPLIKYGSSNKSAEDTE